MHIHFGYTADGRKVHMGVAFDIYRVGLRCIQGPPIVRVLGSTGDGREELFQALRAAKVAPSRLCGHCFPVAIRKAYADAKAVAR